MEQWIFMKNLEGKNDKPIKLPHDYNMYMCREFAIIVIKPSDAKMASLFSISAPSYFFQ